jgi:hypothetical protein
MYYRTFKSQLYGLQCGIHIEGEGQKESEEQHWIPDTELKFILKE